MRRIKRFFVVFALVATGCATSSSVPRPTAGDEAVARQIFFEERARGRATQSTGTAQARYGRVKARVRPAAENYCRTVAPGLNCSVRVELDTKSTARNAYQYYDKGQPVVRVTLPMVRDMRNDDELAFVMAHEFGHHIAGHIQRQRQSAELGALLGAAAGAALANNNNGNQASAIVTGAALGGLVGQRAFSQAHELEADTLGTYITDIAGYDPLLGARYFARPASTRQPGGALSFWGTHPPNDERLATVIAAERYLRSFAN